MDCKNCPKGRYTSEKGVTMYTRCKTCSKGTYSSSAGITSQRDCIDCVAGTYNTEEGCPSVSPSTVVYPDGTQHQCVESCVSCRTGFWSGVPAATTIETCVACGIGKYNDIKGAAKQSDCKLCPLGRFGLKEALSERRNTAKFGTLTREKQLQTWCQGCGPGFYLDEFGKTKMEDCKPCNIGMYIATHNDKDEKNNIDISNCKLCDPGRYNNEMAATSNIQEEWNDQTLTGKHTVWCKACKAGTYSLEAGQSNVNSCVACAVGKFQPRTASQREEDCIDCPRGYYGTEEGLETAKDGQGKLIFSTQVLVYI